MVSMARLLGLWLTAALAWMVPAAGAVAQELVWELETWQVPFDYSSRSRPVRYEPLDRATRKWRICASYPHLKDSYWLSVNYGMVLEAERLGVALQVVEAGGYPNLARQIAQVNDCTARGTDILVVGTVSFEGLTPTVQEIAQRMPVTALVNDIADPGISAKTGVSWTMMGSSIGEYLARRHPRESPPVKVAWFPGPKGSGWVPFVEAGFREALRMSSAEIVVDILVVGTVSFEGLTPTVQEIAQRMPVTALVNDIADPGISAKTGVSWTMMGSSIGEYLARRHPRESPPVKVAWFPGPKGSGWVPFVEAGFREALRMSSAEIVVTKYGDTGREIQLILVEEVEERPDVDYIVGSGDCGNGGERASSA